jgi:DNA processing protein
MYDDISTLSPDVFPTLLREMPQAPKKLHVRGSLPSYDRKWIAIVGSRAYTPYGRQVTEHLVRGLAGYPVVIVSGLAIGIDAIAHKAALESNLPTVAIPGSGLGWDVLYPRSNVNLARTILSSGGAILSELDHDIKAAEWTFPKRNRIMAGMCHATLVIEAAEQSGTLITARLAADYNRDVLVVPGPIFNESSEGANMLLRLGATPIRSAADILDALHIVPAASPLKTLRTDISESELRVLTLIANPISRDELLEVLGMDTSTASILLSTMELKGLIVESMGVIRAG